MGISLLSKENITVQEVSYELIDSQKDVEKQFGKGYSFSSKFIESIIHMDIGRFKSRRIMQLRCVFVRMLHLRSIPRCLPLLLLPFSLIAEAVVLVA